MSLARALAILLLLPVFGTPLTLAEGSLCRHGRRDPLHYARPHA